MIYVFNAVSVFRTFSELDLLEMEYLNSLSPKCKKVRDVDMLSFQSLFDSHTIFSIFFKTNSIYN